MSVERRPAHEEKVDGRVFDLTANLGARAPWCHFDDRERLSCRYLEGLLLTLSYAQESVFEYHERFIKRLRKGASWATAIAVVARATAPSMTAWSAAPVMLAAANSGWWLTAPFVGIIKRG